MVSRALSRRKDFFSIPPLASNPRTTSPATLAPTKDADTNCSFEWVRPEQEPRRDETGEEVVGTARGKTVENERTGEPLEEHTAQKGWQKGHMDRVASMPERRVSKLSRAMSLTLALPFPSSLSPRPVPVPSAIFNLRPVTPERNHQCVNSVVSRSRREARKAHFGAASDERRVRMAAPLSKSLKAEHGVRTRKEFQKRWRASGRGRSRMSGLWD